MKKNEFDFAVETLNSGKAVVFGTIIRQFGSSPRGLGARIVISADGQIFGTIGGGQQEVVVRAISSDILSGHTAKVVDFELTEVDVKKPDLSCGGNVSILLQPVYPEDTQLVSLISKSRDLIHMSQTGWLLSQIPSGQKINLPTIKCLISSQGQVYGNLPLEVKIESQLLSALSIDKHIVNWVDNPQLAKLPHELMIDDQSFFIEPLGQFSIVNIIGAGHVAQKLAALSHFVGFRTVVVDDRPDFLTTSLFPDVDKRILSTEFNQVFDQLNVDKDTFIICVTRSHLLDQQVLSQALRTCAGYIGMIGSSKKVNTIFSMLEKEGFSRQDLKRVHAPIGLEIGAETPEEIAVSIVAELIHERSLLSHERK